MLYFLHCNRIRHVMSSQKYLYEMNYREKDKLKCCMHSASCQYIYTYVHLFIYIMPYDSIKYVSIFQFREIKKILRLNATYYNIKITLSRSQCSGWIHIHCYRDGKSDWLVFVFVKFNKHFSFIFFLYQFLWSDINFVYTRQLFLYSHIVLDDYLQFVL